MSVDSIYKLHKLSNIQAQNLSDILVMFRKLANAINNNCMPSYALNQAQLNLEQSMLWVKQAIALEPKRNMDIPE